MSARKPAKAKAKPKAGGARKPSAKGKAAKGSRAADQDKPRSNNGPGVWGRLRLFLLAGGLFMVLAVTAMGLLMVFPLNGPDETDDLEGVRGAGVPAEPAEAGRSAKPGQADQSGQSGPTSPPPSLAGVKWGQEVANMGSLEVLPASGPYEHRRPLARVEFEGQRPEDITLALYKGRLAEATIWLDSQEAYHALVERLSKRYGPPTAGDVLTWTWPDVTMTAAYVPSQGAGVLTMTYIPLARQAAQEQTGPRP